MECVCPCVDDGAFPVKRELGDRVRVAADIYQHGHAHLAAVLLHRCLQGPAGPWREAPLQPLGNDRWEGSFELDALGPHEFTLAAWPLVFASWRQDTERKRAAGQDIANDLIEGAALARQGAARAGAGDAGAADQAQL
ncbi:MAG: maltotransferase domain-containing protein, partial [Terriglobales bacterium]